LYLTPFPCRGCWVFAGKSLNLLDKRQIGSRTWGEGRDTRERSGPSLFNVLEQFMLNVYCTMCTYTVYVHCTCTCTLYLYRYTVLVSNIPHVMYIVYMVTMLIYCFTCSWFMFRFNTVRFFDGCLSILFKIASSAVSQISLCRIHEFRTAASALTVKRSNNSDRSHLLFG